jgi:putative ABC transport system permease protein
MFKNYLKTAWRNLWKNKVFSGLNIVGLAIGMAACIVIMLFVFYERSFDRMHSKNIYRLNEVQSFEGMVAPQNVALSMFPMGPTLKAEFPEVKNFTRLDDFTDVPLTWEGKKVYMPRMLWTDSTFLQIFDFPLLKGDRNKFLDKPNSIALTQESATKLFGNVDPMGKTVMFYGRDTISFIVTGILGNTPRNSHLQFDGLFSLNTVTNAESMQNWGGNWLITYLELEKGTDIAALEKKFPDYLKRHMSDENWKNYKLFLQPLKDVHSGSVNITHDYLNFQKFDSSYTYIFSVIALIVLVIACINFMNLSTARSAGRAREVGVRKSIGAGRLQLAAQFVGESIMLTLISLVLAIIFVKLLLPYVSNLSKREIDFPFTDPQLILIVLAGTVAVGAVSGLYPAAYLSSFEPTKVLKGSPQTGRNKSIFRNVLVVGQFTAAIFLMIATVFALRQLRFMQQKDPGFNREQVMVIPLNDRANRQYQAMKQELLKNSLITAVSASQQRLGNNLHQTGMRFKGDGPERSLTSSQVIVDPDFLTLYKIPLVAGRNFSKEDNHARSYIINETLAKELLKDNPKASMQSLIGARFGFGWMDSACTIVGVAKDFNFNSLHHKIETLSIVAQSEWGFEELSVRINGSKSREAIAHIQATWNKFVPETPFEYVFLDDHFKTLYEADMQVSEIVGALATLAIIISCLGLFGLASYSAERRIKEIGIRKVLGASVQNVVAMLSGNFLKLVLIANLIAWPVAWYALDRWLTDFAYRVEINWWVFVLAGVAALLIALLTVSFQAIRAALSNPVKSLRTE